MFLRQTIYLCHIFLVYRNFRPIWRTGSAADPENYERGGGGGRDGGAP